MDFALPYHIVVLSGVLLIAQPIMWRDKGGCSGHNTAEDEHLGDADREDDLSAPAIGL